MQHQYCRPALMNSTTGWWDWCVGQIRSLIATANTPAGPRWAWNLPVCVLIIHKNTKTQTQNTNTTLPPVLVGHKIYLCVSSSSTQLHKTHLHLVFLGLERWKLIQCGYSDWFFCSRWSLLPGYPWVILHTLGFTPTGSCDAIINLHCIKMFCFEQNLQTIWLTIFYCPPKSSQVYLFASVITSCC